jgi:hypothetical protein
MGSSLQVGNGGPESEVLPLGFMRGRLLRD